MVPLLRVLVLKEMLKFSQRLYHTFKIHYSHSEEAVQTSHTLCLYKLQPGRIFVNKLVNKKGI